MAVGPNKRIIALFPGRGQSLNCAAGLAAAAGFFDQTHRRFANEDLGMELLAPGERRDVAVFVKRLSVVPRGVAGMKLFAERSTSVRVGTMLEKELRKACVERLFRVLPAAR